MFLLMLPALLLVIKGPTVIDRIVAANVIGTKTAVLLIIIGTIYGNVGMFVDFALAMQEKVSIPLMVTGGLRRREVMEQAITSGSADMVGLARPMCVITDAPARLMQSSDSIATARSSSQPFCAAAMCIEYSPLTW